MISKRLAVLLGGGVFFLAMGWLTGSSVLAALGGSLLAVGGAIVLFNFLAELKFPGQASPAPVSADEPVRVKSQPDSVWPEIKQFDSIEDLIRDGGVLIDAIAAQVNGFSLEAFKLLDHYHILSELDQVLANPEQVDLRKLAKLKGQLYGHNRGLAEMLVPAYTWDLSLYQRMRETIGEEMGYISQRSKSFYATAGDLSGRLVRVRRWLDRLDDDRKQTEVDFLAATLAATVAEGQRILNDIQQALPAPRGRGLHWFSFAARPPAARPAPQLPPVIKPDVIRQRYITPRTH
ncbi:MAG: hypothetical protein FOGNACKC_00938 [Anaerolineae bacterium]|nr:hypothetical protein [Anaerolineae bacterium]